MECLLEQASWICGPVYEYGEDDAGYYEWTHRNQVLVGLFELDAADAGTVLAAPAAAAPAAPVRLQLAVLGYARVTVNGRALSDVELLGHWTNFTRAVYWDEFDITGLVQAGTNEIRIELGNGFFNPAPLTLFGKYNLRERLAEVGTPAALCAVAVGLGEDAQALTLSDESWQVAEGQLLFNNLYLGEVRDLRLPQEGAAETLQPVQTAPQTRNLERYPAPLPARSEAVAPVAVRELAADEAGRPGFVLDFGQMVEGVLELRFSAAAGQRVDLAYAEVERAGQLSRAGQLNFESNAAGLVGLQTPYGRCPGGPGAPELACQRDVLFAREGENRAANTFTVHSFRYVEVRGLAAVDLQAASAVRVSAALPQAGSFACDNERFDQLLDAAVRTKRNNVRDIFEDCSRERFGYGGDMVALATSNIYVHDIAGLLDRTLADLRRDQTARGGLPETAPFMGIGSNGPAYGEGPLLWQLAYPYLAVTADRYYDARSVLAREWPGLVRFAEYLLGFDPAELSACCLGDHGSVLTGGDFKGGTPDKEFVGWCAILWSLVCVAEAGERLGRPEAARYRAAAEDLLRQIRVRFGHEDGSFGCGTQTSWAFAGMLSLGAPERCAERLAADMAARGDLLTCGIFGTMLAFELLDRTGHDEAVERWLLRREHPSLLSMVGESGALAESFVDDGLSSFDHAMFSSYVQWFYQGLGGIRVADDAVACSRVLIRPYFSRATDRVSCSYETPAGTVSVRWERADGAVEVRVQAPRALEVTLDLPGAAELPSIQSDMREWVVTVPEGC